MRKIAQKIRNQINLSKLANVFILTERPVAGEHVGEVGYDVEGGVDDVCHGQVDDEVVRHGAHSSVGHYNPYNWKIR